MWCGWRIDDTLGEVLDVVGGIYGERSGSDVHGMVYGSLSEHFYVELVDTGFQLDRSFPLSSSLAR